MKIVAERLTSLRHSMGITQAKLAEIFESKQAYINRYEHDETQPSIAVLCQYADFFDVSLDYICGRTDEPQGKLYEVKPTYSPDKELMSKFIEMCFEPGSLANKKLRETMLKIAMEDQGK